MFGDKMKKLIKRGLIFVALGFLLGEVMFGDVKKYWNQLQKMDTYYFLQEGMYSDLNELQSNMRNISQKLIDTEKDKYYVYVGITKDKEIAETIIDIYEKKGFKIHAKEKSLSSPEFSENVNQFDLLIKDTEEEDQILVIEKVVLANYEEIVKKK